MTNDKLISLKEAIKRRQSIDKLVFTNGHFDLLHVGHILYLQRARALGEALFVGLNSDESTVALKGPKRPLVPQADRAQVLAALECVDAVIIFNELTAHTLIEALKPEIYAKGGDYALTPDHPGAPLPEAPLVQSYGGHIELIPYRTGSSTTELINCILERFCD
jgi:rfaE bifunctional protein nucleotidyltransferase chain/domain